MRSRNQHYTTTARTWIQGSLRTMPFDSAMMALEVARIRLLNKTIILDLSAQAKTDISSAICLLESARNRLIQRAGPLYVVGLLPGDNRRTEVFYGN